MFSKMKVPVILINILTLIWFGFLHYYRFGESGQACSGDYHLYGKEAFEFKPEYMGFENS